MEVMFFLAIVLIGLLFLRGKQTEDPTAPASEPDQDSSYQWQGTGFGFGPKE